MALQVKRVHVCVRVCVCVNSKIFSLQASLWSENRK